MLNNLKSNNVILKHLEKTLGYIVELDTKYAVNAGKNGVRPLTFLSIKAMRKLAKMARIYFFRTLEINYKLAEIWGAFIKTNA